MADQTVLWWIKKDFRLNDNPALCAALRNAARVVPVFVFEPSLLKAEETSAFHVVAWCDALADLKERLGRFGGELLILHDHLPEAFDQLHQTAPFSAIYSHEEVGSNVTFQRDKQVAQWCKSAGVQWHELRQTGVFRGKSINRDDRTDLWNRFMKAGVQAIPQPEDLARLQVPEAAQKLAYGGELSSKPFGHPLTPSQQANRQRVSETAAEETLHSFLFERGIGYSGGISSPNSAFDVGSRLSVHLAWGTITGRRVFAAANARMKALQGIGGPGGQKWRSSIRSFISRVHWRDHFMQRLETEPQMEFEPLCRPFAALPTPGDPFLDEWVAGQTGWPLIDACMRCVAETGFLNFRMRALVVSAACHGLRINWRLVHDPLARFWADYEPGIHFSQIQMQAGMAGINQLRVYSPDKQFAEQDPDAVFVRHWVPELAHLSAAEIQLRHMQKIPGYPKPLVDWETSSKQMKADYFAIKKRPETRAAALAVYEKHGSRKKARTLTPVKQNCPIEDDGRPKQASLFDIIDLD